ncbi:retrovirus-related pol polyprotein from transposon TNT 1-94 [Tanacetum coccineum]
MSESLRSSCVVSEVLRSIHVALLCVQNHAEDRPTMLSVVLMLVSESALPEPKQPGFFNEETCPELVSLPSVNECTISLFPVSLFSTSGIRAKIVIVAMATKFEIEKFNGNNFSLWKLKMKAILRKDKCLAAIGERPAEVTDDSKWDEMDGNAIANLHLALADGVLSSIEEKKTAKEIWDHLARLYEARTLHNKNFLKRKLYALRMTESTSVTEHVNNLNTLFSQLTSLDCKIDPQERAEILLQSLPDSYDQVIINLTSNVLTDCLVFDDVAASVLEEENRRNNREDRQTSSRQVEALAVTRGKSMEPSSSGSHNHGKSKTGKKKNLNAQMWQAWSLLRKIVEVHIPLILREMSLALQMMVTLYVVKQRLQMKTERDLQICNDHELKIIGIGSIMVKMHDGGNTKQDHENVKGALVLIRGEKVAANLYQLKGEIIEEAEASVVSHSPSHKVAVTWHQKLRHMSKQGMKILVERKLIPGLTKVSLPFCEYYVISKQHRLKFKASNSRSVSVLELVHSDVWQAPVLSLGGAKYFVSFIDDYSRRCWVYPIKKKSDVFEVFKVYKARVELDSGTKIKCLRTDNGGEYTGDEFDLFCKQEGIKRQFTTAYTPQQNGVAERMNRTLLERARAMLATASLGKSFWAEAVNTACYVINRSPSTAVELKTPMEMWTGKPVNYSDLHIFGSPVYVMYNTQETTKLDPKSRKCLFLGYADGVKGYRLWDPTAHKVVVSRDVVFMEDKVQENEESDSTTRETTTIQMEKEFQSNDSSEAVPQHEVNETTESQAPTTRTSDRERRRPGWQSDYVMESNVAYCLLTEEGEPSTLQEALNNPDASFWKEAMQEEIEALHKNKTWELVPLPGGRKPIGNKWVYKIKRNGDDQVERYRARLVVKGYAQKEGIDFNEIFSPVVRMTTIRVVLAMCATYDLHLEQLDVKTAFLHGNLEEEIYMLQPEGFEQKGKENLVCRLNKSLYGLKQAPRCWYKRFDSFIIGLGYNRLHADPCPNKDRISKLKAQLAREFEMKDLGPANKILGMQIHRDRVSRKIWLSQKSYVKKILQRFNMQDCKPISTPFATNIKLSSKMSPSSEKERMEMSRVPYASAVGSLMFAMICTRPDIFTCSESNVALCYGESGLTVKGYVDSDYAGDLDGSKSTTGYVFTLSGGIVSWVSKLQSVVAMSTTEAEYVAAAQASKEAVWLKMLLEELGHEQEKITLFCDNQSALYLARNPTFHSKTKHIRVQYHFVREKVEEGTVDMQKIHTDVYRGCIL